MCKSCVSIRYRSTAFSGGIMSEVLARTLSATDTEDRREEEMAQPPAHGSPPPRAAAATEAGEKNEKGREMRLCAVCGDVTERRHLNYGGEACFSCRAFFRRIHQKVAPPTLECKQGGGCVVTPGNRRRCQKCRYERCLVAGMRPECVMDEQQRRTRSTKMQAGGDSSEGGAPAAAGGRTKNRRRRPKSEQNCRSSAAKEEATPPMLQLRPTYQLQESSSVFMSASPSPYGSATSSSPSPPVSPPRQHLPPQAGTGVHYPIRQEQVNLQLQDQYEQLRLQQQQQEQSVRRLFRPHQYLLPYRRPFSPPRHAAPFDGQQYREELSELERQHRLERHYQHPVAAAVLSPTPSPPELVPTTEHHHQPQPRPIGAASNCTIIKSLLQQDDASEPIPSGLLFSPFSASKQIETKKEEAKGEEEKPKKFFSKKRMILERLEMDAKRKKEEASEVVDSFLERRGSSSSAASLSSEGEGSFCDVQEWLDYMKESWSMAVHQMGVTPEFRATLVNLHRGGGVAGEAKARMREYVFAITRVFRKFAMQQSDFRVLSDEDQSAVVMRNAPIFVQYVFARYATARGAKDKNDWLLLEDGEGDGVDLDVLETFTAFAVRTGLFPRARPDDMFRYEALLRSLDEPRLTKAHNHLVARACLFHLGRPEEDPTCRRLREEVRIRVIHETNLANLERVAGLPGQEELRCLLGRLDDAVEFFSLNADFFGGTGQHAADVLHSAHALALPPSEADMLWLKERAEQVRKVTDEVPFDSARAREAVRFHYLGEALSTQGAVDALAVNLERCKRLLRSHPEFLALPERDREILEKSNTFKAVALGHVRYEVSSATAASPEHLWSWMLGEDGRRTWSAAKAEAGVPSGAVPVRRYCLREVVQQGRLTEEELFRFEKLCQRLGPAVRDDRVFSVVLLLVLFSGSHRLSSAESRRAIAALQRRYIVTLKRTLCFGNDSDEDKSEHYASFLDQHLLEINMCLREIAEIVFRYYQRTHASLCNC